MPHPTDGWHLPERTEATHFGFRQDIAAIGACWSSEAIRQAKFTARFNGTPALVRPHRLLLTRRMVRAFLPLHTIFRRSRGDIPYWELLGVGCLHRVPTDLPHCSFSFL